MLNLTHLAVLEPGEDGSYSISFPDLPGCFSYGDNLAEAQRMAKEAASLHVYGMERDGDEIPTPLPQSPQREHRRQCGDTCHNPPRFIPGKA